MERPKYGECRLNGLFLPVFPEQAVDPSELPLIGRYEGQTTRKCLSCNERVIRTDWLLTGLQLGPNLSSDTRILCLKIQNFNSVIKKYLETPTTSVRIHTLFVTILKLIENDLREKDLR